jgi:hypothetical protein
MIIRKYVLDTIFLQTDYTSYIIAFSTIILVIVTGYYALQTRNTVEAVKSSAEIGVRPFLKGSMRARGPGSLRLQIENIGKGPANNVHIEYRTESASRVSLSNPQPSILDTTPRNWSSEVIMSNEIEQFFLTGPNKNIVYSFDYFHNSPTTIFITGSYSDILGNQYFINQQIDVTAYTHEQEKIFHILKKDPLNDIASSIKEIERVVKSRDTRERTAQFRESMRKIKKPSKARSKSKKSSLKKK